jgi:predicted aminopeptidase
MALAAVAGWRRRRRCAFRLRQPGLLLAVGHGHLKIMSAARPVEDWLGEPQTPERLRERLSCRSASATTPVSELKLPDNPSYRRYADLHRSAAVWNVTAAPAVLAGAQDLVLSRSRLRGYRGYYDEARPRAEAAQLASEGYESNVYPVTAYSTLGWMNWAGGDPLLNTFIGYPRASWRA